MYSIPYHKEQDKDEIIRFINQFPFAFLTGVDENNSPVATQVPMIMEQKEERLVLYGHVMRQSDHHKAFVANSSVLAVFTSPNIYVSASWYTNPQKGSTWNYMSVHARGHICFLDDVKSIEVMKKLTLHFEGYNTNSPTVMHNLPEAYINAMIKGIGIFKIEVETLDTVFKLSQDRDKESYLNIINQLHTQGTNGDFIASQMEKRFEKVFGQPNE